MIELLDKALLLRGSAADVVEVKTQAWGKSPAAQVSMEVTLDLGDTRLLTEEHVRLLHTRLKAWAEEQHKLLP